MLRNKDSNSYIKYLAVLETIIKNSDINHPMSVKDIQNHVYTLEYDFSLDHRLIKSYILSYNDFFDDDMICYKKIGRYTFFYYTNAPLEIMEARAILDLVYGSDFFTSQTKENYKKRIQTIFNVHYQPYFDKALNQHIVKNENDKVFYKELEVIIEAIHQNKKISFYYNKPSIDTTSNNVKISILAPIDTCFTNNEYYLLCKGNRDENLCIPYRLDYISDVKIIDDSNVIFSSYQIQHFNEKINNMTYMYTQGELEIIEIGFDKSVYSNIIDKFGKPIHPYKIDDQFYQVQVKQIINSTFYSWIIGFGGKIQIVGNINQVNKFKDFLITKFDLL